MHRICVITSLSRISRITSLLYYSGRRLYKYNEDDFRFKYFLVKIFNGMDKHTHRSQERLSIKKGSFLITCKLDIRRKLLNIQN